MVYLLGSLSKSKTVSSKKSPNQYTLANQNSKNFESYGPGRKSYRKFH